MYEQKRADDASEKVEKLNEEVSKDEPINKTFQGLSEYINRFQPINLR